MGEMKRREAYESDQVKGSRYVSTLVIASTVIVAVRLAREDLRTTEPEDIRRDLRERVYGKVTSRRGVETIPRA
jgi:hypothetical protein